jgi:hypothetical protein
MLTRSAPVHVAILCGAALLLGAATAWAQSPTPDPQPDPPPDGFTVGDFTFKPGGRIKLDWIRDFDVVGNEDSFDTRTIAVDGSEGTNSNLIAKESRLSLDIRGPWQGRELRMYVETDFYGSGSALRLRHAYGKWGGLLAGQYWSTFVDEDNFPSTIDFESPTAFAQIRQAQVRWTQKLSEHFTWAAAIEDNKSNITVPSSVPGKAEYAWPDGVARLRYDFPRGHINESVFLGGARFRPEVGDIDSVALWGAATSIRYNPTGDLVKVRGKDSAYSVITFGDGIGRYRGGTTAIPDDTGELHAIGGLAWLVGYEHFWSSRYSTNADYSVGDTKDESFYTSAINKRLTYGSVNFLWWFLGDRGWTGVEYLYGKREVYGGDEGNAHRLQYAVRFNLP